MKKIYFSLVSLLFLLLGSCAENTLDLPVKQDGENILVQFSVNLPAYKLPKTRAIDENAVSNLYLLVFDEKGDFLKRTQATLTNQTGNTGNFSVTLPASNKKRYIHFIANYDWSSFDDAAALYKNEGELIAPMYADNNMNMWARVELVTGINANSFVGNTVNLIRNMAKVTVVNNATNLTNVQFAVHRASTRGTVAPFNTTTYTFTEGTLTEPIGVAYTRNEPFIAITEPQYIYGRRNKTSGANYTCVIVSGTYNGVTNYYKLDIIDTDKNRYDIERNFHYQVTINSVLKEGYTSAEGALNGAAANNVSLDPIIEKYPIISDGVSKLEVDKTLHVFVRDGSTLETTFKYFPDINSNTVNNTGVTATLHEDNPAAPVVNGTLSIDIASGKITANINNVPTDNSIRRASIIVKQGELSRTIRLELRPAYTFSTVLINGEDPAVITGTQGTAAILTFTMPNEFPDDLLPYPVRIYTNTMTPTTTGLQMGMENGGNVYYILNVTTKGLQEVNFKTNLSGSQEVVYIRGDLFETGSAGYNINSLTGNISYTLAGTTSPVLRSETNNLRSTKGFINIPTTDGIYNWRYPASLTNTEQVLISFRKQYSSSVTRMFTANVTLNGLNTNPNINLTHTSSIIHGAITYGSSNTPVPAGSVTTVSAGGSVEIVANGEYEYTFPIAGTPPATATVTSLVKISNNVYEEYTATVNFADVAVGNPVHLGTKSRIIIYGNITYAGANLVPSNSSATDYQAAINGTTTANIFTVYATGKYRLSLPGNTAENASIRLRFRTWWGGTWYSATKTLADLRTNSNMNLVN